MQEVKIRLFECIREKDSLIPEEVFNDDPILNEAVRRICKELEKNPIYIDRNVAIFPDSWLA